MNEIEYLTTIVQGLVHYKDSVRVVKVQDDRGVLLRIYTEQEDAGKVIGRGGMNINAIRTLMKQFGFGSNQILSIKYGEDGDTGH